MKRSHMLSALVSGLALIGAAWIPCSAQEQPCEDSIYAVVYDDVVTVYHLGAFYNCCATIEYSMTVAGDTIDLTESETFEFGPCYCLCCFDLSTDISGLAPGAYLVRVWGYEYAEPDLTLFGEVWVTVGGAGDGGVIASTTQSGCYGGDFSCGDCNGDEHLTVADATYLVSFIYRSGPAPFGDGDTNRDHRINVGDGNYIVTHLYRGGPAPCEPPLSQRAGGRRSTER